MPGPQVLIAEDDELLRSFLAEMLTGRGVRVAQAADGMQAAQMLEDHPSISLLLSDVQMPHMDGHALVEKALLRNLDLKVIMMTAHAGDQPPPALLKAREIKTIPKPFDMERMCDRVVDMLARP